MHRAFLISAVLMGLSATAFAEEVELVSGEVLQAEVFERTTEFVVIDHPLMGRIEIPAVNVVEVRPGKLDAAVGEAAAKSAEGGAAAGSKTADKKTGTLADAEWKWSVEIGAGGQSGNVDSTDIRTAINGLIEDDKDRWTLGASYRYADTEKVKTKDQGTALARKDWLLPDSKYFIYAGGRFDYDDFQEWDYRVTGSAGVGYQWIATEETNIRFAVGLAGTREYEGNDDSWRLEGVLGFEGAWKLSESQSIESAITLFPDLETQDDYRVIGDLGWKVKLDTFENMSLKVGLHDEYDSHRESPFDRNDFQWYIALLFDL